MTAEAVTVAEAPAEDEPTPLRTWLRARPERPIWVTAAVLTVAQLVLRGILTVRGTFFIDDFVFESRAASHPLLSSNYLLLPYNSHVMPGSFAWVWALTRLAPLQYGPVAAVDLALQLVVDVLAYKLLVELFGRRPAILVPFALVLFTPITLPATLWWAAALNQLPQQIALLAALRLQVRYLRTGRTRLGVYGALAVAVGLLFSEKTVLTIPLVYAVTVVYFGSGRLVHRVRAMTVRHWRVWAVYVALGVGYAAFYRAVSPSPVSKAVTGAGALDTAGSSFGHALLPGLLGGPWSWRPIGYAGGVAAPGPVLEAVAVIVCCVLIAATIAVYQQAVLGWSLAAGYAVVTVVLLIVSRAALVGSVIGDEYRYLTDAGVVCVLGASLAVLPLRGGTWRGGEPVVVRMRVLPAPTARRSELRELTAFGRQLGEAGIAALLTTALVLSCVYSTIRYDRLWHRNRAGVFLANARADLAAAGDPVIADNGVPQYFVWGLAYPYNAPSKALRPLPHQPQYLRTGVSTDRLFAFDDDGHLRTAQVTGASATNGPVRNCGWLVSTRPVTIRFSHPQFPGTWVLQIGYFASAAATATVTAGETSVDVAVRRGLNNLYVQISSHRPVAAARISALTPAASICASGLSLGEALPVAGTGPR